MFVMLASNVSNVIAHRQIGRRGRWCCTIATAVAELGPSAYGAGCRGERPLRTRVQLHTISIVSLCYYHSNSPLALWNRYLYNQQTFLAAKVVELTLSCLWSECRPSRCTSTCS